MFSELITSFSENIKHKATNPFLGTLVIVWSIHNWEFLYKIFNFPSTYTIEQKMLFISEYLNGHAIINSTTICACISIVVLLLTYIAISISRLIVNIFDLTVTPYLYKWTDKSSVVLKYKYDDVLKNAHDFERKYENEHEEKTQLGLIVRKMEEEKSEILEYKNKSERELKEKNDNIKNRWKKGNTSGYYKDTVNAWRESLGKEEKKYDLVLRAIKDKGDLGDFDDIITLVNLKEDLNDDIESIKYLIKLGVVEEESRHANGRLILTFTNFGKQISDFFINNKRMYYL